MKNIKLLSILIVVVSSFLFIQCTSDNSVLQGPQGEAGIDGTDGTNGINGVDGSAASCIACHSNSHRDPINNTYFNISKHGTSFVGFAAGRGDSDPSNPQPLNRCAQCHSEEGYIDFITLGESNPAGYTNPSPFSCTTCHDKHNTFDFENDGPDFALRAIAPVSLVLDQSYSMDFGGTSNNCITCHQPRSSYDIPGGTADYEITSKRFGPHHSPQATMLEGILGANIAGSEVYPAIASSTHRTGASCVSCHMGATTTQTDGIHSFVPNDAACTACHTNGVPTEVAGLAADMETLRLLLDANGMFDADGYYVPGTYSAKLAQAAWNYKTILEDNSNGIHNPAYAKALVKNSIEALQ